MPFIKRTTGAEATAPLIAALVSLERNLRDIEISGVLDIGLKAGRVACRKTDVIIGRVRDILLVLF